MQYMQHTLVKTILNISAAENMSMAWTSTLTRPVHRATVSLHVPLASQLVLIAYHRQERDQGYRGQPWV